MEKIFVRGGRGLHGELAVSGMKNAALPILFASVLAQDRCVIRNLPPVSDVALSLDILRAIGATVEYRSCTEVVINTREVCPCISPYELDNRMRASYYLIGAELGRFGRARVGWPGGCNFGDRPLDQHMKGFEALGAQVYTESGYIVAAAPDGLRGATIYLDVPSVGATINILLAAVTAPGTTVIENAAREPHIVDVADFLCACGARIEGAGSTTIRIEGVTQLHGCTYSVVTDMIEAGTYMAAVAATGGELVLHNVVPEHLESVSAKLCEMGVTVRETDRDTLLVRADGTLRHINIKTFFYPGFPTDMQPQFAPLLCRADGISTINEGIWSNRFRYVEELRKMGANIAVDGATATFVGNCRLQGARVVAVDLRAGAAMIIAGLIADGETEISNIEVIDRGFYDIVGKLTALGADIRRMQV